MIYNYYLSIGSNIEPRYLYLKKAVSKLGEEGTVKKKTGIY